MNLNTIDDFLYLKAKMAIDAYFLHLKKGFKLINLEDKEIPKEKEHLIKKYFGANSIEYQVASTTFISEVFHIIETYLKSNLLRVGEYLIYPSIDRYPENKEKLDNYNLEQKSGITKILVDLAKATVKKKEDRVQQISKKIGHQMFSDEKDILVNSVTCSEALYRLEKYLKWNISIEVKERFKLFIENRNEIIHFNRLTNLTFAASHSLYVLSTFSSSNQELYPKFSLVNGYLEKNLEQFNILTQEILFNIDIYKVIVKAKENAKVINDTINKLIK